MVDLLTGNLGCPRMQGQMKDVGRIIICGNSVGQIDINVKVMNEQSKIVIFLS